MAARRGDFEEIAGRAVIAGHSASEDARERAYAPAIHPLRKKFLQRMMDHPNSGLPDFGRFKCASRINPTCVVKPAGDACGSGCALHRFRRGDELIERLAPAVAEAHAIVRIAILLVLM